MPELNTPRNLQLFFWARILRRSYVGHDNLKVELLAFSYHKVPLTSHIHENDQEDVVQKN